MLRRLKNLWSWSNISPYDQGKEVGQSMVDTLKEIFVPPQGEIVYPNKVTEVLQAKPDATLDEIITRT